MNRIVWTTLGIVAVCLIAMVQSQPIDTLPPGDQPMVVLGERDGTCVVAEPVRPGDTFDCLISLKDRFPFNELRDGTVATFYVPELLDRGIYSHVMDWEKFNARIEGGQLRVTMTMPPGGNIVLHLETNIAGTAFRDTPTSKPSVVSNSTPRPLKVVLHIAATHYVKPDFNRELPR